jgi:hypothetical protein
MSQKLTEFITLDEKDINSDSWCGICGSTQICMPYRSKECHNIYCYYCLLSKMQEAQDQSEDEDNP